MRAALNAGASPFFVDSHYNTALHLACGKGSLPATKLLLEAGASRTVVSKGGFTPADRAAITDHKVVVKAVQAAGYSTAHKQREFVRNLLRGIGAPTAEQAVKYSGGSTTGRAEAKTWVDEKRRAMTTHCPPTLERLLKEEGYADETARDQFLRGMMIGTTAEITNDWNEVEVARRFGGDASELITLRDRDRERRRAEREAAAAEAAAAGGLAGAGTGDSPADSLAALLSVARLGTSLDAAVSTLMAAPPSALAGSGSAAALGLSARSRKQKLTSPTMGLRRK